MGINWQKVKEEAKINEEHMIKEKLWTQRIVKYIVLTIASIVLICGIIATLYVNSALKAVNPDRTDNIEVTIPIGSTSNDIARILKENQLIKNDTIFRTVMKFKSVSGLQAGTYDLNQSMDVDTLIATLQAGGKPIMTEADNRITVIEGSTIEEIAKIVSEKTAITEEEFLSKVNDDAFIQSLANQYPSLLSGMLEATDLKYKLEGYLFPATYDYFEGESVESLITQMVEKMNIEYHKVKEQVGASAYNFHQLLTLASIIEKEGVTEQDRQMISGVFYNRLASGMPLQSDITVLYVLGEHKTLLSIEDTQVDSPYNLYQHTGFGPGPYNSPSLSAIKAALEPTYHEFYYFVADITTGYVYYAVTLEEHEALVAQYVNSLSNQSESNENASRELTEQTSSEE